MCRNCAESKYIIVHMAVGLLKECILNYLNIFTGLLVSAVFLTEATHGAVT